MPAGRPTKYSETVIEQTLKYLSEDHAKVGDLVPSISGLTDYLDVNNSTVYLWRDKHPEFSNMLEKIKRKQERMLLSGGLSGDYNLNITKLMLAKHGYTDKDKEQAEVVRPVTINLVGVDPKEAKVE